MTLPVYPVLPGLTFTVVKTPKFNTLVQPAPDFYEVRIAQTINPAWSFTLIYDFLHDFPWGSFTTVSELRTLMGFFNWMGGKFRSFLFDDPDDNFVGPGNAGPIPAIAFIQANSGFNLVVQNVTISFTSPNTSGNCLVVDLLVVEPLSGGTVTVSDSLGNSYTTVISQETIGSTIVQTSACLGCKAGANNVNVSYSHSGGLLADWIMVAIHEYSGVNGVDASTYQIEPSGGVTASLTTTVADDYLHMFAGAQALGGGTAFTQSGTYTPRETAVSSPSTTAWVQGTSSDAGATKSFTTTFSNPITAGNSILVDVLCTEEIPNLGGVITVTDSLGNTYASEVSINISGSYVISTIFACFNCRGGSNTVTVAYNYSADLTLTANFGVALNEYSGCIAVDVSNAAQFASGGVTASVTTTHNADMLHLFATGQKASGSLLPFTQSGSYTLRESHFVAATTNFTGALTVWDEVAGSAGGYSNGVSSTSPIYPALILVGLVPASAGLFPAMETWDQIAGAPGGYSNGITSLPSPTYPSIYLIALTRSQYGAPNVPLAQLGVVTDGAGNYYSPIQRTLDGNFWEDITDLNGGIAVYANGSPTTNFTIEGPGLALPGYSFMGLYLKWIAPPAIPVTAQFQFYFRVRFESDEQDFEKFLNTGTQVANVHSGGYWTIGGSEAQNGSGTLKLTTARPTSL